LDEEKLANVDEDATAMSLVGDVVIKVFRCTEGVQQGYKAAKDKIIKEQPDTVHEKALKCGDPKSHAIS
jgi:hypothetical protein